MRGKLFLLVFSVILAFSSPAWANKAQTRETTHRILNASVGLVTEEGLAICGGTLISPQQVITAAHCQEGMQSLQFFVQTFDGEKIPFTVESVSNERDLMLLHLNKLPQFASPIKLNLDIEIGDIVLLVGCPSGLCFFVTGGRLSQGGVFNTANDKDKDKYGTKDEQRLYTESWAYHGSSGGGMFDEEGNFIGVVTDLLNIEGPKGEGIIRLTIAVGPETIQQFLQGK